MGTANHSPLVFATVGTDHHPFHRLVEWVDSWYETRDPSDVRCFVQYGSSRPPRSAESSAYVPYGSMRQLMREATTIVSHGGPATIMECRSLGFVPIVLPRKAALNEHVDGHQSDFSERLAAAGDIMLCNSSESLHELLDRAVSDPASFRAPSVDHLSADAIERFGRLVERLVEAPER